MTRIRARFQSALPAAPFRFAQCGPIQQQLMLTPSHASGIYDVGEYRGLDQRGWAEINHQDSPPKFATAENSDIQQFENPRDEARSILQGTDTPMRRPKETGRWFLTDGERDC